MPDHYSAMDYTATGPSTAGFKTQVSTKRFPDRPTCDFGADLRGKQSGVRASGAESGVQGTSDNTGVHGEGGAIGVRGESETTGVLGVVDSNNEATGVIGLGKRGATGVIGICAAFQSSQSAANHGVEGVCDAASGSGVIGRSIGRVEVGHETELPPLDDRSGRGFGVKGLTGTGVGVAGISERNVGVHGSGPVGVIGKASREPRKNDLFRVGGIGVQGQSEKGEGVFGESESGTGIRGYSKYRRGGIFESGTAAQLQLIPHGVDFDFPSMAKAGDMLVRTVMKPVGVGGRPTMVAELWFCVKSSRGRWGAVWGRVEFDTFK